MPRWNHWSPDEYRNVFRTLRLFALCATQDPTQSRNRRLCAKAARVRAAVAAQPQA